MEASEALTQRTSRFSDTPHLSYSQINKYLTCPEKYRLYYKEGLRPRVPSASLVFGQLIHQALAHLLGEGGDPVEYFRNAWESSREVELDYGSRDSWDKLLERGVGLLQKFQEEELEKFEDVLSVEAPFEVAISGLEDPFVGVIDLVARIDGQRTVIDFKTSKSSYSGHEAEMSDQLLAYALARPDADRVGLCVLVKTKSPKIEWHFADLPASRLQEYLWKARLVAHEIEAGRFFKRPGLWCNWCDFLPVCLGNEEEAEETLVRINEASG